MENSYKLTLMHMAKILQKETKGTRNNEKVAKEMICICDLRFLLKIFQNNANFLKESHFPRAL